jgi:hypothetical protein
MSPEIYWKIRSSGADSCRQYMTLYYTGSRRNQEWNDLWLAVQSTDLRLTQGHAQGGFHEVCRLLAEDDCIEMWLTRVAAQISYLRTGEVQMLTQLQAGLAPGLGDLAPDWAVSGARDSAKALYMQQGRVGHRPEQAHAGDDDGAAGSVRKRRQRGTKGDGKGAEGSKASATPKAGAAARP